MKPMPRETTRARATPTQTFSEKYHANMEAVRAEVITATPVERSNSPPIISRDTPTAMMPMVEDPYSTVANELGWMKVDETTEKKTNRTIAPTRAPTSGRPSSFWNGLRRPIRSSAASGAGLANVCVIGNSLLFRLREDQDRPSRSQGCLRLSGRPAGRI